MKQVAIGLALSLLTMSSALAQARQFDLVCTGTDKRFDNVEVKTTTTTWTNTYVFDLDKMEWCYSACPDAPFTIADVTEGKIILHGKAYLGSVLNEPGGEYEYFDRYDGTYHAFRLSSKLEGQCKSAPFTGFKRQMF